MDALALGNNSAKSSPPIILHFEQDCPHNTTISSRTKGVHTRYVVATDRHVTTTRVVKAVDGCPPTLVGDVSRGSFLPDNVTLNGITMRLNSWLQVPTFSDL